MPPTNAPAFDAIAAEYDAHFSQSLTGNSQRMQVRRWLSSFLENKKDLNILEINCGTGDDALWLHSLGHRVLATDVSGAMIAEAKNKPASINVDQPLRFMQCAFDDLLFKTADERFDLIFSNFSGLNCVSANEKLGQQFHKLLHPGGHLAVVIFGKYNWWETIYYLLRAKPAQAFRRWRKKVSTAVLKEGSVQPVYYYSTKRFCHLLGSFKKIEKRPVGLFIPPSYLESFMQRRPGLFRWLQRSEKKAGGTPAFSQLADHQYLLLKKVAL